VITRNPGHLRAFDYTGFYRYFLTFCTESRQHLFTKPDAVDLVHSQFVRAAADEAIGIVAHCFMPDHVHVLTEALDERSDGLRFIKRAKQLSGFYYAKRFGHRLWQRYGFERVLRNEDATLSVARYIFENPVRAGLVSRPEEYPFIGSTLYSVDEILAATQWCPPRWSG
jgi:putative transposase